jgi:SAM-dependent methyltransferase
MDIGCGSGRLHLRYGIKTYDTSHLAKSHPLVSFQLNPPHLSFDPVLTGSLCEVWGIDFSQKMIDIAQEKLHQIGLSGHNLPLTFDQGSAFELKKQSKDILPVAICLVNSIGVMQGYEGAKALFQSMRRAVERANGIAIISCYQQEYIRSYGLGQYESTMDVSGQPLWMTPETYASEEFKQVPKYYKHAYSLDDSILVDVFDMNDKLIKMDYVLIRDPKTTKLTIQSGDINTYSDYKSHWYSFNQIDELIHDHWKGIYSYHIKTRHIDRIRAEPAQMAILDPGDHLKDLFKRWNIS